MTGTHALRQAAQRRGRARRYVCGDAIRHARQRAETESDPDRRDAWGWLAEKLQDWLDNRLRGEVSP